MSSYTVNFGDGSSHTYDNVPEGVTEDAIRARAGQDYSDKDISGISTAEAPAGQHPIPGMGTSNPNTTVGQDIIAAGQTGFNLANQFLSTPIGHAVEAVGGYKYGVKPLLEKYLGARANIPTGGPAGGAPTSAVSPTTVVTQTPKQSFGFTPQGSAAAAPAQKIGRAHV